MHTVAPFPFNLASPLPKSPHSPTPSLGHQHREFVSVLHWVVPILVGAVRATVGEWVTQLESPWSRTDPSSIDHTNCGMHWFHPHLSGVKNVTS